MATLISSHVSIKPMATLSGRTEAALKAIDSVHSDGDLGFVKIFGWHRPTEECGLYRPSKNLIRLNTAREDHEFTLAHEIGHVLAIQGIGLGRFVCDRSSELAEWREAIRASKEHENLSKMKRTGLRRIRLSGVLVDKVLTSEEVRHAEYLLLWEELWARSYSQFIALSSGNQNMLAQFRDEARAVSARFFYEYWDEPTFGDIRSAISNVLKLKGWI